MASSIRKGFAISGMEAPGRDVDPDVDRMLATHVHCGKPMRLVTAEEIPVWAGTDPSTTAQAPSRSVKTYQCVCGFSFDRPL